MMSPSSSPALQTTAPELLRVLTGLGIELRVESNQVRWRAKSGVMSVTIVRQIKAHEAELIALLAAETNGTGAA